MIDTAQDSAADMAMLVADRCTIQEPGAGHHFSSEAAAAGAGGSSFRYAATKTLRSATFFASGSI